jgi:hypothetical protein
MPRLTRVLRRAPNCRALNHEESSALRNAPTDEVFTLQHTTHGRRGGYTDAGISHAERRMCNRTQGLVKLRQKLVGSDKVEVTETEEKISVDLEKLSPIPLVIFELASPEFGSERALGVCDC